MSPGEEGTTLASQPATKQESAELLKLQAETRAILQQTSSSYSLREWLKALTGLAAIGALLWSIATGLGQLDQARQDKQQQRLDTALIRLGGEKSTERLVGVSTVRPFLTDSDQLKRSTALMALVSAMIEEDSMPVRGAMLAALKDFRPTTKDDVKVLK